MTMIRAMSLTLACLVCQLAADGRAQSYPSKVVRYVVPTSAGAGADVIGRIVAAGLTEVFGQQVIVDNRVGASGNIGAAIAAKRPRTEEQVPRALASGCDPEAGCGAGL
jgi:tripartite-type tricarboxylate transporter receptor subunit TctC